MFYNLYVSFILHISYHVRLAVIMVQFAILLLFYFPIGKKRKNTCERATKPIENLWQFRFYLEGLFNIDNILYI